MKKTNLIVLEGGDGAGKSTQLNLIKEYLKEKNLKYEFFHFPMYGHNQFSDIIERFLRGEFGNVDEVDPLFVANIYAMDRFRFMPELEKALNENDVVLLDRYVYSNVAYQCAKYDDDEHAELMKEWILSFEYDFLALPYPDLNLFLDVPIEITKQRLEAKREGKDREYLQGKQDIHEADLGFQEKVRNAYINSMSGFANCQIINCTRKINDELEVLSPEELFDTYKEYINLVLDE